MSALHGTSIVSSYVPYVVAARVNTPVQCIHYSLAILVSLTGFLNIPYVLEIKLLHFTTDLLLICNGILEV